MKFTQIHYRFNQGVFPVEIIQSGNHGDDTGYFIKQGNDTTFSRKSLSIIKEIVQKKQMTE